MVTLALLPELGYESVFTKLCLGAGDWFGSLRVCAIDGTIPTLADISSILTKYTKQAGYHGGTGYPQARVVALITCGTRSIIDAVFGPTTLGETTQTPALLRPCRTGPAKPGAHYLVRIENARHLPVCQGLDDGSYLSVLAGRKVRVITAAITLETDGGQRTDTYRLITTLTDPAQGTAKELMGLYHQRWEIETAFREIKSTMGGGKVLRSRTVVLVEQEIYALLIAEQLLRTVMAEATNAVPGLVPAAAGTGPGWQQLADRI